MLPAKSTVQPPAVLPGLLESKVDSNNTQHLAAIKLQSTTPNKRDGSLHQRVLSQWEKEKVKREHTAIIMWDAAKDCKASVRRISRGVEEEGILSRGRNMRAARAFAM